VKKKYVNCTILKLKLSYLISKIKKYKNIQFDFNNKNNYNNFKYLLKNLTKFERINNEKETQIIEKNKKKRKKNSTKIFCSMCKTKTAFLQNV
jgi:hypothetical protein